MSSSSPPVQQPFSLAEARKIIGPKLFRARPAIYFADFLVSATIAMFFYRIVRQSPLLSPMQLFSFVVSSLLFYRMSLFIHELVHLRSGTFAPFRAVWNLICGIPFLMPSFIYYSHIDHHRRKHFGTDRDGEYLPLGQRPSWHIVLFLLHGLIVPPLAVVRFLLLVPLTWLSPAFRRLVHRHASSIIIDPAYIRPLPTKKALRTIRLQEALCFAWCLGIAVIPPVFLDRWPIPFLVHAYATGVFILTLNGLRTLGSHRWVHDGGQVTFIEQMLDSVNYPTNPIIAGLWGPIGTRYHALHHLFPSLPYHSMPAAHRRLIAMLPENSLYRQTTERSLTAALTDLWQRSSKVGHRQPVFTSPDSLPQPITPATSPVQSHQEHPTAVG